MNSIEKITDFLNKKTVINVLLILYLLFCLYLALNRIPFFDEAHSYLISQFSFKEIFIMTRLEGHPFLYYLLLKLTNINSFFYPYPMLFMNWVIGAFLTVFFVKKSPFGIVLKFLVLFSYPFFSYFNIVARPYGLTVLFVFLLAYFYNKNKPILFSWLLLITFNTSAMGMISALTFALMFLYKIFKEKSCSNKQILSISVIAILTFLLFVVQFFGVKKPAISTINEYVVEYLVNTFSYVVNPFLMLKTEGCAKIIFKTITFLLFYGSIFMFYKKSKQALFYFLFTSISLSLFFVFVYFGYCWHYFFYFVNFIVALWLCYPEIKEAKKYMVLVYIFFILSIIPSCLFKSGNIYVLNSKYYKNIYSETLEFYNNHKGKYFCFDGCSFLTALLPYFKKDGIKIYSKYGFDKTSFDAIKLDMFLDDKTFEFSENFIKNMEKGDNYLLSSMENFSSKSDYPDIKVYEFENYKIAFKLAFKDLKNWFAIYKIEVEHK